MRKILTLMLLGVGWTLAGCEQQQDSLQEPAQGLPQNEAPSTEPDVQIGQGDPVDPGEPASPGIEQEAESDFEPNVDVQPGDEPDVGGAEPVEPQN